MTTHTDEFVLLSESVELSFDAFLRLSGLTHEELQLLMDCGALVPRQVSKKAAIENCHFNSHYLISIRKLARLKQDFELDSNVLGLMLVFLERVRTLEEQVQHLHQHTSHSTSQ